ncbi:MAG: hypothetical protein Hens3KO_11390 [Henriciella sp.]
MYEKEQVSEDIKALTIRLLEKILLCRQICFSEKIWERAKDTYSGHGVAYLRQAMVEALIANLFRLLSVREDERGLGRAISYLKQNRNAGELFEAWQECRRDLYRDKDPDVFFPGFVNDLSSKWEALFTSPKVKSLRDFRDAQVAHYLDASRARVRYEKAGVELREPTYDEMFEIAEQAVALSEEVFLALTLSSYDFGRDAMSQYVSEFFGEYFDINDEEYRSNLTVG